MTPAHQSAELGTAVAALPLSVAVRFYLSLKKGGLRSRLDNQDWSTFSASRMAGLDGYSYDARQNRILRHLPAWVATGVDTDGVQWPKLTAEAGKKTLLQFKCSCGTAAVQVQVNKNTSDADEIETDSARSMCSSRR